MTWSAEGVLFWIFALMTVVSALGVVVGRNPIASAMSLVATFFFLAGIYVLLWAHTIAVFQILVYAGAIMVLFLFVIMLLSLGEADLQPGEATISRIAGGIAAAALFVLLGIALAKIPTSPPAFTSADQIAHFGTLAQLGDILYTTWLFPFEAVSLLLLTAIVGAVVVAKSRI